MKAGFALLPTNLIQFIFLLLDARDLGLFTLIGCKSLNRRIFKDIREINIAHNPEKQLSWPSLFLRSFSKLNSLVVGDCDQEHGVYMPGLDLSHLPDTLTRLELHLANGFLSLLSFDSPTLEHFCHSATLLPLHSMFPHLQHLHFKNNYSLGKFEFRNLPICASLSSLPLRTLTLSPLSISINELFELPSCLEELTVIPDTWKVEPPANVAPSSTGTATPSSSSQSLHDSSSSSTRAKLCEKSSSLPPNLTKLDLRNLSFFKFDFLPLCEQLRDLRLSWDDTKVIHRAGAKFDLASLPRHLLTFHLRFTSMEVSYASLALLPTTLTDLRLYVFGEAPLTSRVWNWTAFPRSLRILHLFTLSNPPLMESFNDFPSGLADLATNICIPLSRPLAWHTNDIDLLTLPNEADRLNELPASLVRLLRSPPTTELSPLDFDHPQVLEFEASVGEPIVLYADRLSHCRRIQLLNHKVDRPRRALREMLSQLPLESFGGSAVNLHYTLHQLIQLSTNAGTDSEKSSSCSGETHPRLPSNLKEIDFHQYRDGWDIPDLSLLKDENRFPHLKSMSFPSHWCCSLLACLPQHLTYLDIVSRPMNYSLLSTVPVDTFCFRALDLFPMLPRSLIVARLYACFMDTGNVFALLPPKLQDLFIQDIPLPDKIMKHHSPLIPIDQLLHLPRTLTRLTLPAATDYGLLITSSKDIQLLHSFFNERPQMIDFNIWFRAQSLCELSLSPLYQCYLRGLNLLLDWPFASSFGLPKAMFQLLRIPLHHLMPSRSLHLALCDHHHRKQTSPLLLVPSPHSSKLSPRTAQNSSSMPSSSTNVSPSSESVSAEGSTGDATFAQVSKSSSSWRRIFSSKSNKSDEVASFKPIKKSSKKTIPLRKLKESMFLDPLTETPHVLISDSASNFGNSGIEYALAYKAYIEEKEKVYCEKEGIPHLTYIERLREGFKKDIHPNF